MSLNVNESAKNGGVCENDLGWTFCCVDFYPWSASETSFGDYAPVIVIVSVTWTFSFQNRLPPRPSEGKRHGP